MNSIGKIYKISISSEKGMKKTNINSAEIKKDYGIIGDVHAGSNRQISLLPIESFNKVANDLIEIKPGDFAENITTSGFDFRAVSIGKKIKIGEAIELEITHIGKECHNGCNIKEVVGDCIMPREGVFAKVLKGGKIHVGDKIRWSN